MQFTDDLMIDSLLFWLSVLLASNVLLIVIFWNNYGSRIQQLISRNEEKQQILGLCTYMTDIALIGDILVDMTSDQLRREALELKLPKEHSPRI